VQRSPPQVPFEEELSLSLFQTYKVSLDRLEDNIFTLSIQGFGINEFEDMPYWRYETIVEKSIQWIETLKKRKQSKENANESNTQFELDINKNPDTWKIS